MVYDLLGTPIEVGDQVIQVKVTNNPFVVVECEQVSVKSALPNQPDLKLKLRCEVDIGLMKPDPRHPHIQLTDLMVVKKAVAAQQIQ
jgi:hypothetical protein